MGGAILGYGVAQDRNAPPSSLLGELYNMLSSYALGGHYFILNGFGEAWGYSTHTGAIFTPASLAAWVSAGHIWIDWCGWPGYYEAEPGGSQVLTLGAAGFQTMAKSLGLPNLAPVQFAVPVGYRQPFGVYPFSRGFPLAENLAGTAILHGTFNNGTPLTANGYAACIALTPPGGGLYVYATWTGGSGVPASVVARFVANVVAGKGAAAGIARTPWPGSQNTTPPPTKPPASSGIPWGTVALVTAGAGAVGAGLYYTVPAVRRRLGG